MISGDGLPVSGLITVFYNVIKGAVADRLVNRPVACDLGFYWRPDKGSFFPYGDPTIHYPSWMVVEYAKPAGPDCDDLANELKEIRAGVADHADKNAREARELDSRIQELAGVFEDRFFRWICANNIDWLCALNMTISDAVPVSLGLQRAVARYWSDGRPGGIVYWDHDLFGSYAVYEKSRRVYPTKPNQLTPLPGSHPSHRWVVVSTELAAEANSYATRLRPNVLPNVLPSLSDRSLRQRHFQFLEQQCIDQREPIILAPVRIFPVKGLEISIALFDQVCKVSRRTGAAEPYLLVFGSLSEDPLYAQQLRSFARDKGIDQRIRFLDGVPLESHQDTEGLWRLDEADLLKLCSVLAGGIFFTPSRPDVESVGLGPALAAVAGVPCVTTPYHAFTSVYGNLYKHIILGDSADDLTAAADRFVEWTSALRKRSPPILDLLAANCQIVERTFNPQPWREYLQRMHQSIHSQR